MPAASRKVWGCSYRKGFRLRLWMSGRSARGWHSCWNSCCWERNLRSYIRYRLLAAASSCRPIRCRRCAFPAVWQTVSVTAVRMHFSIGTLVSCWVRRSVKAACFSGSGWWMPKRRFAQLWWAQAVIRPVYRAAPSPMTPVCFHRRTCQYSS